MSAEQNKHSITPGSLYESRGTYIVVDVRKVAARRNSGLQIPRSIYRHPFDAYNWAREFKGKSIVVYCAHGHEVSQAVAGFLRDEGVGVVYLEGGFGAWSELGFSTSAIGELHDD